MGPMFHRNHIMKCLRTSLTFAAFLVVSGWVSMVSAQSLPNLFASNSGMCSVEASSRIAPPLFFQPLVNMSEDDGSTPCDAEPEDNIVLVSNTVCTIQEPEPEPEPWYLPASLEETPPPLIPTSPLSCSITGDPDTCHSHPPLPAPLAWKLPGTGMTPPRVHPQAPVHDVPAPRTARTERQRAWAPLELGPAEGHDRLPEQPPRAL